MGMIASHPGLAESLFTRVQQRVLGLLFGQPGRKFQGAELIRLAASGTGAVHRELKRLSGSGLITESSVGNQRFYQANHRSPVFNELRGLVRKTVGVQAPLAEALAPLAKRIRAAFVYGSLAKGKETARSDVDLMVVGTRLDYPDLYLTLQHAERLLGRPISPHLMTHPEWRKKLADRNHFVAKVNQQPKLFVIGSDDDLK